MPKTKVGIINVTGYAGVELARLLAAHPRITLTSVSGRSAAGKKLGEVFPHLAEIDLTICGELDEVDIAFSALPHKESAAEVIPLLRKGIRVIDLSADFRLNNPGQYPVWYGFDHPAPELLEKAAFGLTELYRSNVASSQLVANPGCYPTGAVLALAPAIKAGLTTNRFIIDSKSGVSGAGRSLSLNTHFAEADENVTAYALGGHRHLPEIAQELSKFQTSPAEVTFVPHLVPMTRGILTTAYATLARQIEPDDLRQIYADFYKNEPFVRVAATPPHTKHTWGSNLCLVYPSLDTRTGTIIAVSALDNLIKGAAGQAIQNMNVMLGLDERTGLTATAVWP